MERSRATPPLRICMVTTFYPPQNFGGDGIAVQRLARALVGWGHHVTVVHDAGAYDALSEEPADTVAPRDDEGVEVIPLRSRIARASVLFTFLAGRAVPHRSALEQVLARGRFDVINFHNVSLIGGPGVLSLGDAVKLYTAHEHWLVCPTHVLYRHKREPCDARQCLRCTVAYRRPPQAWRYTGYLERQLRHVDAFIAMSEFSRRKHRDFGFPRDMDVVPALLPEVDEAASEQRPHARPYFLFVGRLERLKGLDDVIPLFRGGPGADLVIVGDGEHAPRLRELAAGAERIRFVGRIPPGELPRYYGHALALIMPSEGYETFGVTVVEAFRQRTPVIARRTGPLPELIEACGGGELFDDSAALQRALDRFERDPEARARMGEAGYRGYRRWWSEEAVVPRYLAVIRKAAQQRGRVDLVEALSSEVLGAPA